MYYLSILIDHRKYQTVKLLTTNEAANQSNAFVPSFVVEWDNRSTKPVMSIAHEAMLIHHGGFDLDRSINWASLQVVQAGQELTISLSEAATDTPTTTPDLAGIGDFRFDNEASHWQCIVQNSFRAAHLEVLIRATIGGQDYEGKLQLHIVPKQQIFDVVMDFGSEASQLVCHGRNSSTNFRRMPIVENLLDYYYSDLKNKPLHQQTADRELYRSAFFVKKKESVFDPTDVPGKNGEEELINLLTIKDDTDKLIEQYELVSNLKLAHLGAYNFTIKFKSPQTNAFRALEQNATDAVVRLQQAVINYFLQTALEAIRRNTREDQPVYLAIKLLVPNVFGQHKIAQIIYGTQVGLQQIADKNPDFNLKGVEVSTLSESDASFLGYKVARDSEARYRGSYLEPGKRYLVIDVGKGTTDFSILQLHPETKQLASLYRSGFIGAGNVLSYAFIDTVLTAVLGTNTDQRQNIMYKIVKSSDTSTKIRFMEAIEQLKIAYKSQNSYAKIDTFIIDREALIRRINDPNEDALDPILSLLEDIHKQQGSIQDESQIITDTVNKLADRIHRQIEQSGAFRDPDTQEIKVVKLILTGRGFLFEPFRNAIVNVFNKEVERVEDLKKICLQGAFNSDAINYGSNLVGFPESYQLYGKQGRQSKQIDKGNGVLIDVPFYKRVMGMVGGLNEALNSYSEDHTVLISDLQSKTNEPKALPHIKTEEEDFLIRGKQFNDFDKASKVISICGLDYRKHTIEKGPINIFYTGDDFLIRNAKNASSLQLEPKYVQTTQLVVQTLFPFVELTSQHEIPVQSLDAEEGI